MEKFKENGDTGQGVPNTDFGGSEKASKMKCLTEGRQRVAGGKGGVRSKEQDQQQGDLCLGLETRERTASPKNTRETACHPCDPISPLQKDTTVPREFLPGIPLA